MTASLPAFAQNESDAWRVRSHFLARSFAKELGKIDPEEASVLGLEEFDTQATVWSKQTESQFLELYQNWAQKIQKALSEETDPNFAVDLRVMLKHLQTKANDIRLRQKHSVVKFFKASEYVYNALFTLVNPQTSVARKKAALQRFRQIVSYGNLGAWKQLTESAMYGFGYILTPTKLEVEDYLKNSAEIKEGIRGMLQEAGTGWEKDFEAFEKQLNNYDTFIKDQVLPLARTSVALPPELYANNLQQNGVEWSPEELIAKSKKDYAILHKDLLELAKQIGPKYGLTAEQSTPYEVSKVLRANQVTGEQELMDFTHKIYNMLESILRTHDLITVPNEPAAIRKSTPAENAVAPFPHVNTPPALSSVMAKPEYVFPMTPEGRAFDEDSAYWAAAVTLTAHEARPGHELQFMRLAGENGEGSRTRLAFGSTAANAEGWAVYVEHLLMPYYDKDDLEARYGAVQSVLFRVARAFLDPLVQAGQMTEAQVLQVHVNEIGLAESFAKGEFSRYSWRMPGQATSYYFGMKKLLEIKEEIKAQNGAHFSEKKFNDTVVSMGPVPFDVCRDILVSEKH